MKIDELIPERDLRILILGLDPKYSFLSSNEQLLLFWFYSYYQRALSKHILVSLLLRNKKLHNEAITPLLQEFSEDLSYWGSKIVATKNYIIQNDVNLLSEEMLMELGIGAACLRNSIDYILERLTNKLDINPSDITEWNEAQSIILQEWISFSALLARHIKATNPNIE